MTRLGRSAAVVGSALAIAVAFGCGAAGGAATKAVSPCGTANAPTWSPDGTQIAWFGYRWPRPHGHANGTYNTLRAICVSDADGKNLHKVPNTVCSERCSNALREGVGQLAWAQPNVLLAGMDTGIATVPIGQKPKLLAKTGPTLFSTDASGDRVASGLYADGCSGCHGPVKVFSVPSGAARRPGRRHEALQRRPEPVTRWDAGRLHAQLRQEPRSQAFDLDRLGRRQPPAAVGTERHESALVARRQSNRLLRPHSDVSRVAGRVAPGRCEYDAAEERSRHRLRLVSERQVDRLPGLEGEGSPSSTSRRRRCGRC